MNKDLFLTAIFSEIALFYPDSEANAFLKKIDEEGAYSPIIKVARSLSIGGERGKVAPKPVDDSQKLRSVFENLRLETNGIKPYDYSIPAITIALDAPFFPKSDNTDEFASATPSKQLNSFFESLNGIQNLTSFHPETILNLLYTYCSTCPIGVEHLPDVSLYDHVKSVAGISQCLYIYQQETTIPLSLEDTHKGSTEVFLMIGADLSGIQKFIYDIVSKNAAKNLKGRSFYLDLLVDSVIQRIVKDLGLSFANIIYASGGGFYLLAPNLPSILKKLQNIITEISDRIFAEHSMLLFLAVSTEKLSYNDFFFSEENRIQEEMNEWETEPSRVGFSRTWKKLTQNLNTIKRRRYANKLISNFENFFLPDPDEHGGLRKRDAVTDRELTDEENTEYQAVITGKKRYNDCKRINFLNFDTRENQYKDPVKEATFSLIKLGKALRDAEYWITSHKEFPFPNHIKNYQPCGLNVFHYFLTSEKFASLNLGAIQDNGSIVVVRKINDPQLNSIIEPLPEIIYGFTFYGGNKFPIDPTHEDTSGSNTTANIFPISTDLLASPEGEDALAFKRIGILRMDVDGLGKMFINGFDEKRKTFSRYSTLSRSLDLFFKGYLNEIMAPYINKNLGYILYAGGDDLFMLGRWNAIIEVAYIIQNRFREFTCHNPQLTVSGGISILPPKFPIMLGADYAGDAEKKAKGYSVCHQRKNAFTFFDVPLNWDLEFSIVKQLKEELSSYLPKYRGDNAPFKESILSKIRFHYRNQTLQRMNNQTEKWYWVLIYDFSQIGRRIKEENDRTKNAKAFLDRMKIDAVSETYNGNTLKSNYSYLNLLFLAARWVDFEMRTNETVHVN